MAGFRRTRYLTCFYCGRRTSTPYDGIVRQFTCTRCDATNYLDQNGDITDPPVATTSAAASPPSFARQKSPSPGLLSDAGASFTATFDGDGVAGSSNVFCATCLKNQHLFVSSLAQYFPPDPSHPDFAELERKYFRFRKSLERRYPQVCADCEPAVLERIRQAGYTAKTDHLERMVRYSRQVRVTQPTLLDHASRLGHWLWWLGLVFQVLWQLGVVGVLAPHLSASASIDGNGNRNGEQGFGDDAILENDAVVGKEPSAPAVTWSADVTFSLALPLLHWTAAHVDRLRSLCIGATVASCWWNPYFVQTVRGFTKPFIGISTWYAYQAALVFVRIVLSKMAGGPPTTEGDDVLAQLPPALLGGHAFAALFTLYIYARAPGSIRKDLRPLFAKSDGPLPATPPKPQRQQQSSRRPGETQTLSDVLDEISSTPTPKPPVSTRGGGALDSHWWQSSRLGTTAPRGDSPAWLRRQRSNVELGSLNISRERATPLFLTPKTEENPYGYSDEMDWTPSQPAEPARSPYRAFSAEPALPSSGSFGQTPTGTNRGAFWYKVPPAPTSVAKRVLNPPNAPRLFQTGGGSGLQDKTSPSATASGSFFSRHDQLNLRPSAESTPAARVEFAQPRFFASNVVGRRGSEDEAGNSLSDLFSQSFTLGNEEVETEEDTDSQESPNSRRRQTKNRSASAGGRPSRSLGSVLRRAVWGGVLALSLQVVRTLQKGGVATTSAGLNSAVHRAQPYAPVLETAAVGLCAVTAAVLTRESMQRWRRAATARRRPNRAAPAQWPDVLGCLLGILALGLSAWMVMEREGAVKGGPWAAWLSAAPAAPADTEEAPSMLADDIQGATEAGKPWQWWQVAAVHGLALGHQVWNMVWE